MRVVVHTIGVPWLVSAWLTINTLSATYVFKNLTRYRAILFLPTRTISKKMFVYGSILGYHCRGILGVHDDIIDVALEIERLLRIDLPWERGANRGVATVTLGRCWEDPSNWPRPSSRLATMGIRNNVRILPVHPSSSWPSSTSRANHFNFAKILNSETSCHEQL